LSLIEETMPVSGTTTDERTSEYVAVMRSTPVQLKFNSSSTRVNTNTTPDQLEFNPLDLNSSSTRVQLDFNFPTTYPLLPTPYYLRPTPYSLLPITYYLLPTIYSLLPITYYLLPTTYYFYYLRPTPYSLLRMLSLIEETMPVSGTTTDERTSEYVAVMNKIPWCRIPACPMLCDGVCCVFALPCIL